MIDSIASFIALVICVVLMLAGALGLYVVTIMNQLNRMQTELPWMVWIEYTKIAESYGNTTRTLICLVQLLDHGVLEVRQIHGTESTAAPRQEGNDWRERIKDYEFRLTRRRRGGRKRPKPSPEPSDYGPRPVHA